MPDRFLVYIGNYTRGADAAIYHGEIDPETGQIEMLGKTPCQDCPSYLAIGPSGEYLYAVSEVSDGAVSAFAIDPDYGDLAFLNLQPTGGSPCHNTVDGSGRYVLCANYGGGSVSMHPIRPDGSLGEMSDFVQHEGSSVNPQRQEGPHAHSIEVDPGNRFAFCADLGLDKVLVYALDLAGGKLKKAGFAPVAPGAGPRHFAFHPTHRYAYVINEIDNTITGFRYDEAGGRLAAIQSIATLPAGFADIHVAPDGHWLYGSNRGHDSIAMYRIDAASGQLAALGHQAVPATPRSFALDPSGTWLYAGGQSTNEIPLFQVDADSGLLEATAHVAEAPSPVCIKMLAVA